MTPSRINILLAVLLTGSIAFSVHQGIALRRLQTSATHAPSKAALPAGTDHNSVTEGTSANEPSAEGRDSENATKPASSTKTGGPVDAGAEDGASRTSEPAVRKRRETDEARAAARTGRHGSNAQQKQQQAGENEQERARMAAAKSRALANQAHVLMREGDYVAAEELLQQSLEQDVGNRQAWQQMARLQRMMGMTDAEIGTYLQWMESRPNDAAPYRMLAETYARLGMDTEARDYLARYEALGGNSIETYASTAALYRRIQDRDSEGRLLAQWVAAAPDSPDAQRAWAEYQRRQGGYDAALSQYASMASAMPSNPMPLRQMGDIYRQLGDYTQAQAHYQMALELRPGDIDTLSRLADARFRTGDAYGALEAYGEIMALEPGSRAAAQAQQRAASIERQLARP